jgi:tight adherence protein B
VNALVLTIAVFVAALGLFLSALYFLVARPLEQKKTLERFEGIQKSDQPHAIDFTVRILHEDVLSNNPLVNRILKKIPLMVELHFFVKQSALNVSVGSILAYSLIPALALLFIALLVGATPFLGLFLAAAAGCIPFAVVGVFRRKRFDKFEELFPEALDFLARSVRAGHAFTAGLEMISQEMDEPISGEFRRIFEQQNIGMPIKDALQNLVKRVPLSDVQIFTTALIIQRETGGNLAEILDNLSTVMRERFKMTRYIKTVTAQGRMSRNVLLAMAPALGFYMFLVNRDYILKLFTDPLLRSGLYIVIVMQVVGFFWIQKIIKPKV